MKKLWLLSVITLLVLTCGQKEEILTGEQGGTMVIGSIDVPARISPLAPSVFGSNEVMDLLFMHLHHIDPATGKMKPELASSWEFSEDLTSITYYLRTDVTWWDGEPVTAEDIYYTYEMMKDPKTSYPNVARLRFIENVEVLGPHAIKFTFAKVYADLLTDSDIMPVPKHVYEKVGEKFGEKPVGNGPYKIKEWTPGAGLVLEANEAYYKGKPPLDEIFIRQYADIGAMVSDFNRGEIDIVLEITPASAKELEKNKDVVIDSRPGKTYTYIGWNLNHPLLKDKEIRKALSMAINTKKILDDVFLGMGVISLGPLPPSSWGYNEDVVPIQYNLISARGILEKKGFEDRNRNNIFDKDRKDVSLTIITNSENPERVKILGQVTEDLNAIGIRVNARILPTAAFIEALVKREFDGFIMGWSVSEKIDPAVYWHSDPTKGRFNFVSYKNEVVDSLIDTGSAMLNRHRAEDIWNEFQRLIYEDMPYTFLIVANDISAAFQRIKGDDTGIMLANAYSYWIPAAERRVAIASLPPVDTTSTPSPEEPTPTEKPEETPKKPEVATKPPEIVKPEALLEAAAKKETTAVATAPPDTAKTPVPIEPPKPSVITRVEPVTRIYPQYPDAAMAVGATGRIVIRVLVGVDGKVKEATILKSFGNPACEAEALAAAKRWVFKPATKDGVPFEQKATIPFDFKPPK